MVAEEGQGDPTDVSRLPFSHEKVLLGVPKVCTVGGKVAGQPLGTALVGRSRVLWSPESPSTG